jgi:hypothetical protein
MGTAMQYIRSNTLDEVSHADFLNVYLESKGADPVNLDAFRQLQGARRPELRILAVSRT